MVEGSAALWFSAAGFELLDVFEGRDAGQLRAWMAGLPSSWLAQVQGVSVRCR